MSDIRRLKFVSSSPYPVKIITSITFPCSLFIHILPVDTTEFYLTEFIDRCIMDCLVNPKTRYSTLILVIMSILLSAFFLPHVERI